MFRNGTNRNSVWDRSRVKLCPLVLTPVLFLTPWSSSVTFEPVFIFLMTVAAPVVLYASVRGNGEG